jgi:hypothetical protein
MAAVRVARTVSTSEQDFCHLRLPSYVQLFNTPVTPRSEQFSEFSLERRHAPGYFDFPNGPIECLSLEESAKRSIYRRITLHADRTRSSCTVSCHSQRQG